MIKVIETPDGEKIECRLYQMVHQPKGTIDLTQKDIPYERQPSLTYIETIINGAIESQLPEKYVSFLKRITHNGNVAIPEMLDKLK